MIEAIQIPEALRKQHKEQQNVLQQGHLKVNRWLRKQEVTLEIKIQDLILLLEDDHNNFGWLVWKAL